MARLACIIVPGLPYHATHRGNCRCRVFIAEDNHDGDVALPASHARRHAVDVPAWCLMSNHVHLVVRGSHECSPARSLGNAHGKYARWYNSRHARSGNVDDWSAWLTAGLHERLADAVRRNTMTGRPCEDADFLAALDRRLGRILRPMKTGRKPKACPCVLCQ